MSEKPKGKYYGLPETVRQLSTVLFADIVGYTALMQKDETEASQKLQKFRKELNRQVRAFDGKIVNFYGDGCLVLFNSTPNAMNCAVALQKAFQKGVPVPVRIGLHCGDVIIEEDNVFGDSINLASRIESLGLPGTILFSERIRIEIHNHRDLPYISLGFFEFKNVAQPMEVFGLVAEGVAIPESLALSDKAKEIARFKKLPHFPDPFIGRERDIAGILNLLKQENVRLITLLGPGGVGKTRLSVEVGQLATPDFANGTCFVPLDVIDDYNLVPQYIGSRLDLTENSSNNWEERVIKFLSDKEVLLIIDNMEQVINASSFLSKIIKLCPKVKIIVTSRVVLNLRSETEYPLDTLAVPSREAGLSPEQLLNFEGISFFVQKARSIRPQFEFNDANARAVVSLCEQLDGLPLAIELAAARIKLFSPEAILQRLNHSFDLLKSRSREVSQRHQTLRRTIQWSYELLSEAEQLLFQLMALFPGGFTPESLESISTEIDPFDDIESFLNKSLIRKDKEINYVPRFSMLKMIREFGEEQLKSNINYENYRKRFALCFLDFVERNETNLRGPDQQEWVRQFDAEYENLGKAMEWLKQHNPSLACRMGAKWWYYFLIRGFLLEGYEMVNSLLDLMKDKDPRKTKLLEAAGTLAHNLGDYERSRNFFSESLNTWQEGGKKLEIARALNNLGWAEWRLGRYTHATSFSENALKIAQELSDGTNQRKALNNLAWIAMRQGLFEKAESLQHKVLKICTPIQDKRGIAFAKTNLSWAQQKTGQLEAASRNIAESLEIFEQLKDQQLTTFSLAINASLLVEQNKTHQALNLLENTCLPNFQRIGDVWGKGLCYQLLVNVFFVLKDYPVSFDYVSKAYELSSHSNNKWGIANALLWKGKHMAMREDYYEASAAFDKSIELATRMEARELLSEAYLEKAKIKYLEKKETITLELFAKARKCARSQGIFQLQQFELKTKKFHDQLRTNFGEEVFKNFINTPKIF